MIGRLENQDETRRTASKEEGFVVIIAIIFISKYWFNRFLLQMSGIPTYDLPMGTFHLTRK